MQIAERIDLHQFGADLVGEGAASGELRTLHGHFNRRRRPKAHDLADDVRGLERDRHIRQRLLQLVANLFLHGFSHRRRARLQRDSDDRFMLSAGKQIDRVDRVVRRLNADEPGCDLDVVGSNKLLDHVHRLHFDQLGALETCARWRAESEL